MLYGRTSRRHYAIATALSRQECPFSMLCAAGSGDYHSLLGSTSCTSGHVKMQYRIRTQILQIDPKLVLPEWSPKLWLPIDLGFHLVPAISLIIDLLLFSPPWTIAITPSLGLAIGLAFGYWFWIELCYSYNAFYPYPIFTMLDTTSRAMLFATSALIFFVALWSLKFLYKVVNGVEMLKAQSKDGNIKKAQ